MRMEVKVIEDKENVFFNRREISFYVHGFEATPKRDEIKQEICKRLNLSPELTIIVSISQRFGIKQCAVLAHSYKDKDGMERYTAKYILERASGKKKAKAKKQEAVPQKQPGQESSTQKQPGQEASTQKQPEQQPEPKV